MIRAIKQLPRLLHEIVAALVGLQEVVSAGLTEGSRAAALEDRLAQLEAKNARLVAEAEAIITRAESKFGAARAAEERTRRMVDNAEEELEEGLEDLPPEIQEFYRQLAAGNGGGGEAAGVQPVRADVARRSGKAAASAAKWGLS